MGNDILYGYKAMTVNDAMEIGNLNQQNGWGISKEEYFDLVRNHEKARKENDIRTMEMIEYRLEDINFHPECMMLELGDYQKAYDLWE